jgi:hypothetical protein
VDRRRADLHQALDELGGYRGLDLASVVAAQREELVGTLRGQPGLLDQEELLL